MDKLNERVKIDVEALKRHPVQMLMAATSYRAVPLGHGEHPHLHRSALAWRSLDPNDTTTVRTKYEVVQMRPYSFFFPEVDIDHFVYMGLCSCGELLIATPPAL